MSQLVVLVAAMALLVGCRDQGDAAKPVAPEADAILRVLTRHAELVKYRAEAEATLTKFSEVAAVWGRFCDELERLDLTGCPPDFRVAFRQHSRSCRDVQAAIAEFPDSQTEMFVIAFLNGLAGQLDGGFGQLKANYDAANQSGNATYKHLEETALKYGAAL